MSTRFHFVYQEQFHIEADDQPSVFQDNDGYTKQYAILDEEAGGYIAYVSNLKQARQIVYQLNRLDQKAKTAAANRISHT